MTDEDATLAAPPSPPSQEATGDATMLADPSAPGAAAGGSAPSLLDLLRGGPGGKRLRHYLLLGELGRGGMGVVFSAYDETLDRKVAIKVLQSGGDAQRRLVREAQALARLSHPNVVQIYEIGELPGPAPLAFIVMEFIDGHTLKAWREAGTRSRAELLDVFTAAGRGLAAAHAKGLVHRDFKPDNVMLREDGRVVVMDFGLAREGIEGFEPSTEVRLPPGAIATNTSELSVDLTATGALMGTPAYMSPEQFKGEATDAKTDQFSFCVALWEALFGERPFSAPTLAGLSVAVTRGELRGRDRADVPSWLVRVVERGLAVDPGARWPSMDALLDALASDPTQRRRWWIAGLSAIGLVAAVLAGARVVEVRAEAEQRASCAADAATIGQVWNPEVGAELDARFAGAAALASWSRASAWMDAYARDWAALRERSCVEATVEGTRSDAERAKVHACLDDARVAAEAVVDVWQTADPRIVAHAAMAAARLTPIAACDDSAWLAQRVAPPEDPETRAEVARIRRELERVSVLSDVEELEASDAESKALLDAAEAIGWRPLIAEIELARGRIEDSLGQREAARESLERASLVAFGVGHDLAALQAVTRLASVVGYELHEVHEGRYWASLGAELVERLELEGTIHEAALRQSIGDVDWTEGNYAAALASYQRAYELFEASAGAEHPETAVQLANIGYLHMEQGDYAVALREFRDARRLTEAALGPQHPKVGMILYYEADALRRQGDNEGALVTSEQALRVIGDAFGVDHRRYGRALSNYGAALAHVGREDEAVATYERALALIRAGYGDEDASLPGILNNLAALYGNTGDFEAALRVLTEANALTIAVHGPAHKSVGIQRGNLGVVLVALGRAEEGLVELEASHAVLVAALGPEHPSVANVHIHLGQAFVELGDDARARAELERGIELLARNPGDPNLAHGQFAYAKLLVRAGERERGLEQLELARAGFVAAGPAKAKQLAELEAWRDSMMAAP